MSDTFVVVDPRGGGGRSAPVTVDAVDPQAVAPIALDGESAGRLPARFEHVPAAIRLLAY